MRGLGKILMGCLILTSGVVLYVHERVEVLRVSYRIQKRSSELARGAEDLRRLQFEVAQLRSPQFLEKRLEALSLPLTLPQEIRVLEVPAPRVEPPLKGVAMGVPSTNFLDFLGQWIQVAQARPDQDQ